MQRKKGLLVIISSPSGGGKTTIIRQLLNDPDLNAVYSVSVTTRAPREGEQNGKDYWFVDDNEFQSMLERKEFIEHERVHNYFYATPAKPIREWLTQGRIVLLDVDVYGAFSFKRIFAEYALLIFLKPPDLPSLEKRLRNRSTETNEQIEKRLQRVTEEIALGEKFEYNVINNTIEDTVVKVKTIISNQLS